ncbi:MAG TPA: L-rhamnose/proton symporter RhaT, partial [Acidobacteriaceae bacterium]|nr:L-rhamnose/proton symporter RhaT [Acidobacteriaceae bacterium]
MHFSVSVLVFGIACAIVSGIMNGIFTLPMRYLGQWPWENVWAIVMLVPCVLMPITVVQLSVPGFMQVLNASPPHAILFASLLGFAWGFGAIMFGQGVAAIGISMGNTLALAISASFGSVLPILVLAPERLFLAQGVAIITGTFIGIAGIACFGYAGFRREKSQQGNTRLVRGDMVGQARPFAVGLLLCIGSGLLSAVFNIGYSLGQPIRETAIRMRHSNFTGTNLIWLLMLTCGSIPSLVYCGYLMAKNGTWRRYTARGSARLYVLTIGMGLIWGGHTYLYGFASPKLGKLGPSIGWPLTLMAGLITVNACGFLAGEWKLTRLRDRQWMGLGIIVTLVAIAV